MMNSPTYSHPWTVLTVPAFQDNYLWLIHNGKEAIAVDPGDAGCIQTCLKQHDLKLSAILCTHHHADHVGGVLALKEACGEIEVYGPPNESIPGRTQAVFDGNKLTLAAGEFLVLSVPGHTAGHVAYVWRNRVFCGDTLFALGCGRLFEGTPNQMLHSLHRLAELPGEFYVHCAHEYTLSNLAFALAVDPENENLKLRAKRERERRAKGEATVPSLLSEERATNPFLRAHDPALKASAERWKEASLHGELEVFTALREWKNQFRV
jgi:hydroxyacylglutathione hydrolase